MRARGPRREDLLRPGKKGAPVPQGFLTGLGSHSYYSPGEHQILTSSLPTSILLPRGYYHLCH